MLDIKQFRRDLQIDSDEFAAITRNSGIGRIRLAMVEFGTVTLTPKEESILRLAISYAMHCRTAKLLGKVGQGQFDNTVPMTWHEYQKEKSSRMPKTTELMRIAVELQEIDGKLYFPLSPPIPWQIDITDIGGKVLASQPEVLSWMIEAIRAVVTSHHE